MILEINLIKVPAHNSMTGTLIKRKRYQVAEGQTAMPSIIEFIKESESVWVTLSDKILANRLVNLSTLTIAQLNSLRYTLSLAGLDIWMGYVSEVEVNATGVGDETVEYNAYDWTDVRDGFVPFCVKSTQMINDIKWTDVYSKFNTDFNLFSQELFDTNPLMSTVNAMKGSQEVLGALSLIHI